MSATKEPASRLFRPRLLAWVCLAGVVAGIPGRAEAHPESLSILLLGLGPRGLHAAMTLPVRDLSRWFPPGRHPDYIADVVRELRGEADGLLEVKWDDDTAGPVRASVHAGQPGSIIVELDYAVPPGAATLQVRSACLANLPNDHQQATSIEDDRQGSRVLAEETLTTQQDTLAVDLPALVTGVVASADTAAPLLPGPNPTVPPASFAGGRIIESISLYRLSYFLPGIAVAVAGVLLHVTSVSKRKAASAHRWVAGERRNEATKEGLKSPADRIGRPHAGAE